MNIINRNKVAFATLCPSERDALREQQCVQRLNEDDVWVEWDGELEENGVYQSVPKVYDWRNNPGKIPLQLMNKVCRAGILSQATCDLEYWAAGRWCQTITGPEEFPRLAYRVKQYDWLLNPEKRPLGDNESMRPAYEEAWKQGNLEFWVDDLEKWRIVGTYSEGDALLDILPYRVMPIDTSNPDWIVWGKMDERVKDAIRQSDRVQILDAAGQWQYTVRRERYQNCSYRIAP